MIPTEDLLKIMGQCIPQEIYSPHALVLMALDLGCFDLEPPRTLYFRQRDYLQYFSEAIPLSRHEHPDAWRFDFGKPRPGFTAEHWRHFLKLGLWEETGPQSHPPWQWLDLKENTYLYKETPARHLAFYSGLPNEMALTYYQLKKLEKRFFKRASMLWRTVGIGKIFSRWVVGMPCYSRFISQPSFSRTRQVNHDWNANDLIHQEGHFYLSKVCEKMPFHQNQLRYLGRKENNAKEKMGIWKDPLSGRWLINMPIFKQWVLEQKFHDALPEL